MNFKTFQDLREPCQWLQREDPSQQTLLSTALPPWIWCHQLKLKILMTWPDRKQYSHWWFPNSLHNFLSTFPLDAVLQLNEAIDKADINDANAYKYWTKAM